MTILYADKISNDWLEPLKQYDINVYPEIKNPKDITFVISSKLPKDLISQLPNLKCISAIGAGVNSLIKDPQIPNNIFITKIVDPYLTTQVVQYAVMAILNQTRKWDKYLNQEFSKQWKRSIIKNPKEINVGILGLGSIGFEIAIILKNLGFNVLGYSKSEKKLDFQTYTNLDQFLGQLDFMISILPLTSETKGIINKSFIKKLKKGCYLINIGRGEHIVEKDLIEEIDHLSGATLDVFEKEPLDIQHMFWNHPRIIVTPHIAAKSDPKYLVPQIIDNYKLIQSGKEPMNVVDRDLGY